MEIPPPPILMREFATSNMFCVNLTLPDEMMNKIQEQTARLSVMYMAMRQGIGHYDKINKCMMLNGETSLSFYMSGAAIMLTTHENGQWVHHTIWQQQPLDGTRIVNFNTNETMVIRNDHGMLITASE